MTNDTERWSSVLVLCPELAEALDDLVDRFGLEMVETAIKELIEEREA